MAPASTSSCQLCQTGLKKGTVVPVLQPSPWSQAVPFLPICPWRFSSCWPCTGTQSKWVWEWVKSVSWPCKLFSDWVSSSPHLTQLQSSLLFTSRSYKGLCFLAQEPWSGEAGCGAGTPHSSGRTSAADISLLIFICYTWVWDQPVFVPTPPSGLLFISLVMGILLNWSSGSFYFPQAIFSDDCFVI